MDTAAWVAAFTEDSTFTDESIGVHIAVVQLALQGTHQGPLNMPGGTLAPTGNRMDAPCCDVFELTDGKIKRFDCYPEGSIILTQLGVIGNLSAALEH